MQKRRKWFDVLITLWCDVLINLTLLFMALVRATPRVCQILLGKSCVLPTCKKICQVEKESVSNSLA
jgi:hypothetical protein